MPRAVAPHADVMNNAFGLFLPVPELVLPATAQVDLIVGELAAGERLAVGGGGFEVGGLVYAAPQPVTGVGRGLPAACAPVELGIEQELQIVQVVLAVIAVAQQVLHQRYTGCCVLTPIVPGVAGPVENIGVLPFRAEVVDTQAVVVVPRDEREIGGTHEVVFSAQP